jgi:hypothetical protein
MKKQGKPHICLQRGFYVVSYARVTGYATEESLKEVFSRNVKALQYVVEQNRSKNPFLSREPV